MSRTGSVTAATRSTSRCSIVRTHRAVCWKRRAAQPDPYRIYGGVRFFERMEIKNVVHAPDEPTAFGSGVRARGEYAAAWHRRQIARAIRDHARRAGVSLWQASKEGVAAGRGAPVTPLPFLVLMTDGERRRWSAAARTGEHCIEASGLMDFHRREPGERGLARKENLEELISACRQFTGEVVLPLDESGLSRWPKIAARRVPGSGRARKR